MYEKSTRRILAGIKSFMQKFIINWNIYNYNLLYLYIYAFRQNIQ